MDPDLEQLKGSSSKMKSKKEMNKEICGEWKKQTKQRQKDSHLQKKREKFNQKSSGSSIYKEERVLRLMEEQGIPAGSGKVYRFIPAKRNDTVRNTGYPKYLPVKTCGDNGVNLL